MSKLDRCKFEIDRVKENQDEYEFPEFISLMRRAICTSRKKQAEDLGLPYLKLYNLEAGSFKKVPEIEILTKISEYFDVPISLLAKKAKDYVFESTHSVCA